MAILIPIGSEVDVFTARRTGREIARETGFQAGDCSLIELSVSELAANIVNHADHGAITVKAGANGLEIISEDQGAGIADVEAVLAGTGKSAKGLGIGLAGVKRMMDQLEIHSVPGKGTMVVARKWLHPPADSQPRLPDANVSVTGLLDYGVLSIPAFGAAVNGDAYVIKEFDAIALLAVIDGLGHGRDAATAAGAAAIYIMANYQQSLPALIAGCHQALKGTRGAVLGLARVDFEMKKLGFAGIGNIRLKVTGEKTSRPVSTAGIVGHNCKQALLQEFIFHQGDTIFLYSDGISDTFDPERLDLTGHSPRQIAEEILRSFGKNNDDNTIIVAREV